MYLRRKVFRTAYHWLLSDDASNQNIEKEHELNLSLAHLRDNFSLVSNVQGFEWDKHNM